MRKLLSPELGFLPPSKYWGESRILLSHEKGSLFKHFYPLSRTVWAWEPADAFAPNICLWEMWQLFRKQWLPQCWCPLGATPLDGREAVVYGLVCQSNFKKAGSKSTGTVIFFELQHGNELLLKDELCAERWWAAPAPPGMWFSNLGPQQPWEEQGRHGPVNPWSTCSQIPHNSIWWSLCTKCLYTVCPTEMEEGR